MESAMNVNKQLSASALKELEEEALRHLAAGACSTSHSKAADCDNDEQAL